MTECEQTCIDLPNTAVGYKCGCKEGFTLKEDGYSCEGRDEVLCLNFHSFDAQLVSFFNFSVKACI